jgi:hypothetical protein
MAFIESHQSLRDHPKTKKASRLLGITRVEFIGHLHLLWWWTLDYAEDGSLAGVDPEEIADAADYYGDPDKFVDALVRAGFLDRDEQGTLAVHDWWDYAGRLIEQREKNRERQRRYRDAHKEAPNEDVTVTSPLPNAPTVTNRNQPTVTNQPKEMATDKPPRVREPDELFEAVVEACYDKPHAEITDTERKRANQALPELRKINATRADVMARAAAYRARSPDLPLTPQTLTKAWSDLGARAGKGNGVAKAVDISPIDELARERGTGRYSNAARR